MVSNQISKKKKKAKSKTIHKCIANLLCEAKDNMKIHPERTKRYLYLVLKFVSRYKIKLTNDEKLSFCKKCLVYWDEGTTLSISKNKGKMGDGDSYTYTCLNCSYYKKVVV